MMALPLCHSGYRWCQPRPNKVLAQRPGKSQDADLVKRRETHMPGFAPAGAKAEDRSCLFNLVRSIDFLVQFERGGSGASMA
jgi:hypothetical protein